MSERVSEIKPAEIYSDLSAEDIAEMMAEAAEVDALFQSGGISTIYLTSLTTAAHDVGHLMPEKTKTAA